MPVRMLPLVAASLLSAAVAAAADLAQPTLDELKWVARPIIIFADSPADPRVRTQLADLEAHKPALDERDVVVLVDTDPAARSELRQTFRPRDFSVLVLGKDGEVKYRKPQPITVREVLRLIDRMPLRRQEIESRQGGGNTGG
ncbi:DUF4174 domain-containing protein [Rhodobacteraceae bacterium 2CG4]|uniref:DUF4174 domain-containing protein n=1 Tax=Halovulum marinum TaxID=2662447 RepID=A0A6L5Z389_9RHOB|nr:DUF4174 domain-containing protein [Halovulum marinum]MSU91061.1 DUF4174 domain-containing protein [Halovulum marinum]